MQNFRTIKIPLEGLKALEAYRRLELTGRPSLILERADDTLVLFDPEETLSIEDGACLVERNDRSSRTVDRLPGHPLEALKSHLRRMGATPFPAAVGFLGYGCARYLEPVTFSGMPGVDARLIRFRLALRLDSATETATLMARSSRDFGRLSNARECLRRPARPFPAESSARLRLHAPPSEEFDSGFRALIEHIKNGDIFQAVLSRRTEVELGFSPIHVYRALTELGPAPYRFYFDSGYEVVTGASPETLVRVQGERVEISPIAGTRPRGRDAKDDRRQERSLVRSRKESAEHVMLVDLSRNDIARVCRPGSVRVEAFKEVHRFSHVMHLVSRVTGTLGAGRDSLDALFSCFPAGTLTGAPKIRAMQILSKLEIEPRDAYGGAMVFYDRNTLDSCITIRSLVERNGRAFLQAGAGIVADSRLSFERQETEHKALAMKKALRRARQLAAGGGQ